MPKHSIETLFRIIEGKEEYCDKAWENEPEVYKRKYALEYAFDELEKNNNDYIRNKLMEYARDKSDKNADIRICAVGKLGFIGNSESAALVIDELNSDWPDMRFTALWSLAELYKRDVLSKKDQKFALEKFIEVIYHGGSNEDIVECVDALKESNDKNAIDAIEYALQKYSEIASYLKYDILKKKR